MSFLLHISLYRNETCDPEKITSLINHHIPDAKLKTESKEKLVYTLPAERTNEFPGNLVPVQGDELGNKCSHRCYSFHMWWIWVLFGVGFLKELKLR